MVGSARVLIGGGSRGDGTITSRMRPVSIPNGNGIFRIVRSVASLANPLAGSELVAFAIAVECGTLAATADALELTQSAVTKRIHRLERRIGAPLLERGRFGVRPTALGRSIYPEVKRALDGLDVLARLVAESQQHGTAELRLIASLTIGEFLLPGWLGEFRAEHPDVHVQLQVLNSGRVLDAMHETQQGIGFVGGNKTLDGMRTLVVARDEIVVAVARSHPWAGRRTLRARELAAQPYLTREASSGTRAVAQASLESVGVRLEPSAQMASAQSLKRTLAGGGFTLMSRLAIEDEQRAGTLVGIPVADVDLGWDLCAVSRARPPLTGSARVFWRWLQARTLPQTMTSRDRCSRLEVPAPTPRLSSAR
jgi:DNA-binding transcriptional LysR family regulator